jgi:hypothetical protein
VRAIREAGRVPVQRDSLYRPIDGQDAGEEVEEESGERGKESGERGGAAVRLGTADATAYAGASNEGGTA